MVTPKNIIIQDLELADKEIRRLREEVKNLKLVISQMENTCKDYLQDRDTLREENKKLKEYLKASFKREESIRLDYESSLLKIKDLEEEIQQRINAVNNK